MTNNYYPVRATNVCFTLHHQGQWSRFEIVSWINSEIRASVSKVEDLCTGAAYCCLMDKLFPGTIYMQNVKYIANQEYEFLSNFRLVQNALFKVQVNAQIPMDGLVRGRLYDNLEFASWFRRFYEENNKNPICPDYDPEAARGNQFIGLGPSRRPTCSELQGMRRHRRSVSVFIKKLKEQVRVPHKQHGQVGVPQKLQKPVGYHNGEGDHLR